MQAPQARQTPAARAATDTYMCPPLAIEACCGLAGHGREMAAAKTAPASAAATCISPCLHRDAPRARARLLAPPPASLQVPIDEASLLRHLSGLLEGRGHAVVCVAEGAGQDLLFSGARERVRRAICV
jgi:hypothetical protein